MNDPRPWYQASWNEIAKWFATKWFFPKKVFCDHKWMWENFHRTSKISAVLWNVFIIGLLSEFSRFVNYNNLVRSLLKRAVKGLSRWCFLFKFSLFYFFFLLFSVSLILHILYIYCIFIYIFYIIIYALYIIYVIIHI